MSTRPSARPEAFVDEKSGSVETKEYGTGIV